MIHQSASENSVCEKDWVIVRRHYQASRPVPTMSHFGNYGFILPSRNNMGFSIYYIKWDVTDSHISASRYVIGSDGRAWLTTDHYKTFQCLKLVKFLAFIGRQHGIDARVYITFNFIKIYGDIDVFV